MYENFNAAQYNQPTFHTNYAADNGTCYISQGDQRGTVETNSCDNYDPNQGTYQGCASIDYQGGAYGNQEGGVGK